jgi:multiple sugar transport system permease protein/fructooligosaccharide transport system permease protein
VRRAFAWLLSLTAALLFLSPLLWMLAASLRESSLVFHTDWRALTDVSGLVQNYAAAWRRAELGPAFLVSLLQVGAISIAGLGVNSMAAFAFARLKFRGRDALFSLVVALVILPVEVLAVPLLFTARSLGLTGNYLAALAGLSLPFVAKAFNIYFLRQHFLLVPRELEEAGALDGASVWNQFWSIALPNVRPALVTVVLLDVLTHWSDFLWPLLLASRHETRTVQIALANLFTQPPLDWGAIMACSVLATLPVVGLFHLFQRSLVASGWGTGAR